MLFIKQFFNSHPHRSSFSADAEYPLPIHSQLFSVVLPFPYTFDNGILKNIYTEKKHAHHPALKPIPLVHQDL